MRSPKRVSAVLLAVVMVFALAAAALAAVEDTGFSDVAADAWYADAAIYCRDNGLMGGTTATTFAPDAAMTRSMLATVLYRMAGSPAVSGGAAFTDTAEGSWYADAAAWAASSGIISGYGNGRFGANDPVTREQIAAILWRYEGSPAADAGTDFADESAISSWAAAAVDWARREGIISGKSGNRFDPGGNATRAEVAAILMNNARGGQPAPTPAPTPEAGPSVLVAYFSATGNTKTIAEYLAAILEADHYEIVPETPYTSADLNYNNASSRCSQENSDPSIRPAISGGVENMERYDVVFLGYPIWLGQAPNIISTFLERYDFSGKTIVPFCTSGSSGIGSSAADLQSLTAGAEWRSGQRFSGSAARSTVEAWVDGLNLPEQGAAQPEPPATDLRLTVSDGAHTVTFALNHSQAARDLYAQLPFRVAVENYSSNEKIFYPPHSLDPLDAPQASGGAGTLAYYAPWGDVVLFYDDFGGNGSLYGLGQAVEGAEWIPSLSGTVTVQKATDQNEA